MKARRRRVTVGGGGSSSSGQLLALALFVMLLAFFIVLNAISTFEEAKVRSTIQSIEGTFSTQMAPADRGGSLALSESTAQASRAGDVLDKLKDLFRAQIPGYDAVKSDSRGEMYVRVPYDLFEEAVFEINQEQQGKLSAEDEKFQKFFLPALVSLLMMDEQNIHYRMDVFINVPDDPATMENKAPQELMRWMKRSGGLAQKLEEAGLPKPSMSIGLQKGRDGYVDLTFRRYVPYTTAPPAAAEPATESAVDDDEGGA